jgi:hypothetical protein
MKKGLGGIEKIIIALILLFVAKKAIENPKEAKGCLALFILIFIIIFTATAVVGIVDFINERRPLERAPGESTEHRNLRQRFKDDGYGPEFYEYKNNLDGNN